MSDALALDIRLPTDDDLARVYFELAALGAQASGSRQDWPYAPANAEELICLAAQLARYDPRLLGILVELFVSRFDSFNPLLLRRAWPRMRFPQVLAVVLEFAVQARRDPELSLFARYVTQGIARLMPMTHFFVDDVRPGTKLAEARRGRSLTAYSRWGFSGVERPTVDAFRKTTVGRFDPDTRREILEALLARASARGVTLREYLDAVGQSVSRQQAAVDLAAAGLRVRGHGRGARWVRRMSTRAAP